MRVIRNTCCNRTACPRLPSSWLFPRCVRQAPTWSLLLLLSSSARELYLQESSWVSSSLSNRYLTFSCRVSPPPAQTVPPAHHCVFFSRALIVIWDILILLTHGLTHIQERRSSVKARPGVVLFRLPPSSFSAVSSVSGTWSRTGKASHKYVSNERMNEIQLLQDASEFPSYLPRRAHHLPSCLL